MTNLLWTPLEEEAKASQLYKFMTTINEKYNKNFSSYEDLRQWSVENIANFWEEMWHFGKIIATEPYSEVIDDVNKMPGAVWFPGARMNFAENLLRFRDDRTAIISRNETGKPARITYAELHNAVAGISCSLRKAGIQKKDRIVGFMPNIWQTVAAMLASSSIGAIWSSCSPDFGIKGVLDRFSQIQPRALFTADGYIFKGRQFDSLDRISAIIKELPSIEKIIVIPYINPNPDISRIPNAVLYDDFISESKCLEFTQLPFEHPLYIMYSSGTTGLPKCMVQSAGGVLINHIKELMLHTDLKKEDTIFYFTTCGWMMWNWLVSSLSLGASVVLYDGNPFFPHSGALWEMAKEEKITVMGISAGYISGLKNSKIIIKDKYDLKPLKTILSTGSPLPEEGFEFIYETVKKDIRLSSISGGSDINGCFAAGNPMGGVYSGEIQCRALAMDVHAFDDNGKSVINQMGELVCTAPSPSMPVYFWDDPDGKKYFSAYFDIYPGVWRHGDYIKINERGGIVIYGRSDATLNPGGVRIGTAEIYRQLEQFSEIEDSLVIGQTWKNDIRVILFVKLMEGNNLSEDLKEKIRSAIIKNASPRHAPSKILAVPDIPYTLNMKKVELAVKKLIEGFPVLNKDALINPESLEYFQNIRELAED
jgi:acetoacetyl-CoA synthetase